MSLLSRMRASRLGPMLWKEFIQMRRDRLTLAMMLGIPALQLLLFGYAIRTEVRHLPTVVYDESHTAESRALIATMVNTGNFTIVEEVHDRAAIADRIRRGSASAGIAIPPDYARDLKRGRTASAQVIVDAADPLSSSAALSGGSLAATVMSEQIATRTAGRREAPLDVRLRPLFNPALRSSTYIVPGLIGILISLTMLLITSMAVVRERERGTLEQLIVTPIDKTSLMLGKILPFVLVGYVQMTVIILLGTMLFHMPIRGSLVLLYLITFGFIVANLGIGLFISTVVRSQMQAMQLGFLFLMPNILLSGFMFPRQAMPVAAQWLGLVLPLTYYLDVLRGILLKSVGIEYLWKQTLILLGFSVLLIAMSVRRFSKTIE